jgi:hypothetical protein
MVSAMKTILPKVALAWDNGGPWGKAKPTAKPTNKVSGQKPVGQNPVGSGTSQGPRGPQPELEDVVNQMAERLRGYHAALVAHNAAVVPRAGCQFATLVESQDIESITSVRASDSL